MIEIPYKYIKDFKIGQLRTTDYGRTRQATQIVDWREYAERARKSKCILTLRLRLRDFRLQMKKMSFEELRNALVIAYADGYLDDEEFFILYDCYLSSNPSYPSGSSIHFV